MQQTNHHIATIVIALLLLQCLFYAIKIDAIQRELSFLSVSYVGELLAKCS